MHDANGNLSKGERQGLAAGTRVSWQHEGMAEEATGVVSRVKGETLVLRDGREVMPYYYCRHAPAMGGTVEVRVPSAASTQPKDPADDHGESQVRPVPRTPEYREAWERVVLAVQGRLAAGETVAAAVAAEAAVASVPVTVATYTYWRYQMARAGKLQRGTCPASKERAGRAGAMARVARERSAAGAAAGAAAVAMAGAFGARAGDPAQVNPAGLRLVDGAAAEGPAEVPAEAPAQGGGVAAESVPEVLRERVAALASEMTAATQSMECAERLRLLEYGRRSLEQTRALAAALDEAVSTVRRYPWAVRFLRQRMLSAAASKATGGEA